MNFPTLEEALKYIKIIQREKDNIKDLGQSKNRKRIYRKKV